MRIIKKKKKILTKRRRCYVRINNQWKALHKKLKINKENLLKKKIVKNEFFERKFLAWGRLAFARGLEKENFFFFF